LALLVWRVLPQGVPTWPERCSRCGAPELASTSKFRVNANGALHDVWLLYRCPGCGLPRKRSVIRRVREDACGSLDPYRRSDPACAALWAFALSRGQRVAYRVERPPIAPACALDVAIEQPFPCGVRWDAFLARELAWSRSKVVAAWRREALAVAPATRPRDVVRNGDRLRVWLD
jgi:hypothetical protein